MKELQFKQNKGFFGLLVTGIMLVVVCIAFIVGLILPTPESMYKNGDIYGQKATKRGNAMVVAITATSPELTTQNGNSYYLIETEDAEYIALEVPEKFEQFNKEDGGEFATPLKLAVKVGQWESSTQTKWFEVARSFGVHRDFERVYFLSTVDYESSKMWMTVFAVGMFVLGGVVIFSAFKKRKDNGKSYAELVELYPELKDNLTLVKTEGAFVSDMLNYYVYKNHLISTKNGFETLDLSQVVWIDFTTTTYRGNTTAQLPYLLNGETKKKIFTFGNYGKKHVEDMQRFFEFLEKNYEHIALGQENQPEQLGGGSSKKTIAEFVAEQQLKQQQVAQETGVAAHEVVAQAETEQSAIEVVEELETIENKDEA